MIVTLSSEQTDGLVEILNISIGRAAAALSRMVREPIKLSIPSLKFVPPSEAGQSMFGVSNPQICGVTQHFDGPFQAEATLIFSRDRCLDLVSMWIDDSLAADELADLEEETLADIGNIVLYACFGTIANMLNSKFQSTLPEVRFGTPDELLKWNVGHETDTILLTLVDFTVANCSIQGYLALLMEMESIDRLVKCVDRFIDESRP